MKKMKDDLTKTIEIEDSYLNEVLSGKLIEKGYDGPVIEKFDACGPYHVITVDCARQWLLRVHKMHIYTVLQYDIDHVKGYEGWCYKEDTVSMGSHYCFDEPQRALAYAIGLAVDFERTFESKKRLVK